MHAVIAVGERACAVSVMGRREAVVDQSFFACHVARDWEQLDLFGRVVGKRGWPAERIEVVLEEFLSSNPATFCSFAIARAKRARQALWVSVAGP